MSTTHKTFARGVALASDHPFDGVLVADAP